MIALRGIAYLLPQVLILLFLGGTYDMLGGWNQTQGAMGTVLMLFVLSPLAAFSLLVCEIIRICKNWKSRRGKGLLLAVLATLILFEALAIDLYLLTQVRM